MRLISVLGPTNTGKTTLIDTLGHDDRFVVCPVGRILRSQYPVEAFKGKAAPEEFRGRAWEIIVEHAWKAGRDRILVLDGQPRVVDELPQFFQLLTLFEVTPADFMALRLFVSDGIAERRARQRDTGPALELSLSRMKTDSKEVGDVVQRLTEAKLPVRFTHATSPGVTYSAFMAVVRPLLEKE